MGLIDIIMPRFTPLSSAINKFQQHQEKHSWERSESNLGLLGEKQVCYLCGRPPLLQVFRPVRNLHTLTQCFVNIINIWHVGYLKFFHLKVLQQCRYTSPTNEFTIQNQNIEIRELVSDPHSFCDLQGNVFSEILLTIFQTSLRLFKNT